MYRYGAQPWFAGFGTAINKNEKNKKSFLSENKINKMQKYIKLLFLCCLALPALAQDNMAPAPEYKGLLFIKNANVHVGNGQVLSNQIIQIRNGKIEKIQANLPIPVDDVKVFDAAGKEVYPGIILMDSKLGLQEIGSNVFGSNDFRELGDLNPNIRSIVAYNTDSKIINTLRSNGILFAQVVPEGNLLTGSSSVVQLDAWNWEDAVYEADNGIHFNMPSLLKRPSFGGSASGIDPLQRAMERINMVKQFFKEAKIYFEQKNKPEITNLKFEAVKGLFTKQQRFYIHCDLVAEMLLSIDFVKEFNFDVTVVGGSESFQIAPLLKQNNISVLLTQIHALPTGEDDDIDQPFKTPYALQKAGVLYAITEHESSNRGRNLVFDAGTAAAYGLTKEEALQAITLNPAKILGISNKTGSIEVGKDANILIVEGDLLDMRSSNVLKAFIQGRDIDLDNKQKQLEKKYEKKYGVK